MAASGCTASIMRVHNNHNKEKESGSGSKQLSESLSQFGNVKNEFIVSGRSASKNLIQERRFDEAVRVCEMVLAVDPDDIETGDLKERAIVYLNNPDQFDLHEMQKMADRPGSELTPQRLLRSASERRVRKSDGGAIIRAGMNSSSGDKQADKNNNPATSDENHVLQPVKLRRTRSEMHRPNVLERIKEFERQAKDRTNGTTVTRPPDSGEEETLVNILEIRENFESSGAAPDALPRTVQNNAFQKSPVSEPVVSVASQLPSEVQSPRRIPRRTVNYVPSNSPSKAIKSETAPSPAKSLALSGLSGFNAFKQPKTEVLSPVSEDEPDRRLNSSNGGLLGYNGKPIVKWTELGKTVNPNLRSQLETDFFSSKIIKKACIVTLNADVWVCFGWHYVRKVEFETILAGMASESYLTSSKLRMDGTEFSCLSGTKTVVRGRVNKLGVNCTKLNNVLVIVMYEHPVLPKEAAMLVRRFEQIMTKNET